MIEPSKQAFRSTWPGGYGENFVVYESVVGTKESDIVSTCLEPFWNPRGSCLDVGCGTGFWENKYLCQHFEEVIGLDVIPAEWVKVDSPNFTYVEVPDRDYTCYSIPSDSVDFVWSFGCFCHLRIEDIAQYLTSCLRVMRHGAKAALYFSNTQRRPNVSSAEDPNADPDKNILWTDNNWTVTQSLLKQAGFVNIKDLMPSSKDTMAYGEKP